MARPHIGITGPDRGGEMAWLFASISVLRAGGRPVRLRPSDERRSGRIDGLILGGGADIAPVAWDEPYEDLPELAGALTDALEEPRTALPSVLLAPFILVGRRVLSASVQRVTDAKRDDFERHHLEDALAAEIPVLGICRGAQLMNLSAGGVLFPEVEPLYVEIPYTWTVLPRRHVVIAQGSRLAGIMATSQATVNALHHQAISKPGDGMSISAADEAGVIQAIEQPERPFVIGVQWHPEYLPQQPEQRALFGALVTAARAKGGRRSWFR